MEKGRHIYSLLSKDKVANRFYGLGVQFYYAQLDGSEKRTHSVYALLAKAWVCLPYFF